MEIRTLGFKLQTCNEHTLSQFLLLILTLLPFDLEVFVDPRWSFLFTKSDRSSFISGEFPLDSVFLFYRRSTNSPWFYTATSDWFLGFDQHLDARIFEVKSHELTVWIQKPQFQFSTQTFARSTVQQIQIFHLLQQCILALELKRVANDPLKGVIHPFSGVIQSLTLLLIPLYALLALLVPF